MGGFDSKVPTFLLQEVVKKVKYFMPLSQKSHPFLSQGTGIAPLTHGDKKNTARMR